MKTTFDTNTILFGILNGSALVKSAINGGVYKTRRPLNSQKEDIVVNTIALTQEHLPQLGTSNINIHVPDMTVTIAGVQQQMPNDAKMDAVAKIICDVVRAAVIPGIACSIENQTTIEEAEIKQHFVNIRINWFIH